MALDRALRTRVRSRTHALATLLVAAAVMYGGGAGLGAGTGANGGVGSAGVLFAAAAASDGGAASHAGANGIGVSGSAGADSAGGKVPVPTRSRDPLGLYAALGVQWDCTEQELKHSYRRLTVEDNAGRDPPGEREAERFERSSKAYQFLSDKRTRACYDRTGRTDPDPLRLYQVLGVDCTWDCTEHELTRAHRAQLVKFHPDKGPKYPGEVTRAMAISKAYAVLSVERTRAFYDRTGRADPDPLRLYDALDLTHCTWDCSAQVVKRAYRRVSLRYFPDKLAGLPDDAPERQKIRRAIDAYGVLSDADKRAHYDATGTVRDPLGLYEALGVAWDCTERDLKRAYRRLSIRLNPDSAIARLGRDEVEQQFRLINNAYEVLSDPSKRAHYDSTGMLPPPPSPWPWPFGDAFRALFAGFTDPKPNPTPNRAPDPADTAAEADSGSGSSSQPSGAADTTASGDSSSGGAHSDL